MTGAEDFQVLSRLGSGSFGTVYKVHRHADGQEYVIKEIRIAELTSKEQLSAVNEVKLLAKIKSPFVVKYYDYFIDREALHIVMEFCNKGDLSRLIKRSLLKPRGDCPGLKYDVIWPIILQIILGLHYLHSEKILHRDLKSANVFLHSRNNQIEVKIGDLGVAKLLDTSTAFAQTIVGTPYYLSPELCADLPYRDKSDCWALGVILYECCVLRHPFEARHQCALIMKIIQSPVPALPRELPSELERLTMWLLVKDPNGRPTIRDILNESKIREKLFEYQYNLPEDLLRCEVTDRLTGVTPSAGAGGRRTSRTTSSLPPPLPEPPKVSSSSSAGGNRLRGSNVHGVRSPSDRALQRNQVTGYDYTPSTGRAPLNGIQGDREVSGREISEERDGYANENEETIDVFRHEKPMKMIKPHSEEPKNIEVDSKVVPSTVSANKDRDDRVEQFEHLVADTKARCRETLGETLFRRLYDLCARHVARPLDDQSAETLRENERVVRELGDILHEQLLVGAGEAFDTVKKVKVLLAMEGELKKLKEC